MVIKYVMLNCCKVSEWLTTDWVSVSSAASKEPEDAVSYTSSAAKRNMLAKTKRNKFKQNKRNTVFCFSFQ